MQKLISGRVLSALLAIVLLLGLFGGEVKADTKYGNQGTKPADNKTTITVPSDKYKTVQSAINAATEGTTIIIKKNSTGYAEQLKIKKNGITLKGEDGAKICGTEEMEYGDLLDIEGSDIVIENLEFTELSLRAPNTSESAGGIRIKPGSSNVYVLDCKIWKLGCIYNYTDFSDRNHFNGHGISIKGSEKKKTYNITISGCEVCNLTTGRSESVVINNNTEYFTISNNYIHDNYNIGIDCAGGYGTMYSTNYCRNGEVCGNYVENISSLIYKNPGYFDSNGKPHSGADGIYVDGGHDIYVHDNYVTGCDIGLEIASENHGWTAEGVIAERNLLIYNDQYVGLAIGGSDEDNGVAKNNIVRYNTVINSGDQHCLVVKVTEGNTIKNNIFISDTNPRNKSNYYSENDITDNASNRATDLPGTNIKIDLKDVVVDKANKKVTIVTDTDISKYVYDGIDDSGNVTPPEPIVVPDNSQKDDENKNDNNQGETKPSTDNKPSGDTSKPSGDNKPSGDTSKPSGNSSASSSSTKSESKEDQIRAFVERLYTEVLGRESETDGAYYWYSELYNFKVTGADVGMLFVTSAEFRERNVSDDQFLKIMYKTFFNREADTDGFNYWKGLLSSGTARETVAKCFIDSQEWSDTCAKYGIRSGCSIKSKVKITPTDKTYAFVERMYLTALGRAYDSEGREYWAGLLANFDTTGEAVGVEFFLSPEMESYNLSNKEFVNRLYLTFMDREADNDGMTFWIDQLEKGHSRKEVVLGFTRSPEFEEKCIEARCLPC